MAKNNSATDSIFPNNNDAATSNSDTEPRIVEQYDHNNDGQTDSFIIDTDGDGKGDTRLSDTDYDGDIDSKMYNTNGEEYGYDHRELDTSGDGKSDYISQDADSKGPNAAQEAVGDMSVDELNDLASNSDSGKPATVNPDDTPSNSATDSDSGSGYQSLDDVDVLETYDMDEDGKIDTAIIDLDGDGTADGVAVDVDGDGQLDGVGLDTDGDGEIEEVHVDTDGDGFMETVGEDTTGDGNIDVVHTDVDGDAVGDFAVIDKDGDGNPDEVQWGDDGQGHYSESQSWEEFAADNDIDADVSMDAEDAGDDFTESL